MPGKPAIAATATAVPEHSITREGVKRYFEQVFPVSEDRLRAMMSVVDHSRIERRYCVHPVEYTVEPRPLGRTSEEYQRNSIRLGQRVATEALAAAGLAPAEVDLLITVSCTGFMIPSLDAHLIHRMGFSSAVRRLPITELGCAAGAAALARAADFVRAFPDGIVLVIAVELPSLTFQRGNLSQANLISSILFGDGAAAAVVTGRRESGPRIVDSQSYTFPDSLDAMGFELKDTGFQIVLSAEVPRIIRERIRGLVDAFLERNRLSRERVPAWILHPGGQKLLAWVEEELELGGRRTQPSWDVLARYGNLSSASVLFVLDEWLRDGRVAADDYGLLAAFGPGFSAEMSLLEWA